MPDSRPFLRPGVWPPAVFAATAILAAGVTALATGNGEFVFYVVVMVVLFAVVGWVHLHVGFSTALLWALAIWGVLHMAGGLVPVPRSWPIQGEIRVLYSWWVIPGGPHGGWLKYDHLMHGYGFGVTTWACWQGLRSAAGVRRATVGRMVLCAAAGLGFGALNEVVEFAATLLGPTNVGGYVNTGLDLVANTVGATLAAALIYAWDRSGAAAQPETSIY